MYGYTGFHDDVKDCLADIIKEYNLTPIKDANYGWRLENDLYRIGFNIDKGNLEGYLWRKDSNQGITLDSIKDKLGIDFNSLSVNFDRLENESFRNVIRYHILKYKAVLIALFKYSKNQQIELLIQIEQENAYLSKLAKLVLANAPIGHPLRVNLFTEEWKENAEKYIKELNLEFP